MTLTPPRSQKSSATARSKRSHRMSLSVSPIQSTKALPSFKAVMSCCTPAPARAAADPDACETFALIAHGLRVNRRQSFRSPNAPWLDQTGGGGLVDFAAGLGRMPVMASPTPRKLLAVPSCATKNIEYCSLVASSIPGVEAL